MIITVETINSPKGRYIIGGVCIVNALDDVEKLVTGLLHDNEDVIIDDLTGDLELLVY